VAGPRVNEGYTFEVGSLGGNVTGIGKVVSGDGQEAERVLFISRPNIVRIPEKY
jgi:hypothetical protein